MKLISKLLHRSETAEQIGVRRMEYIRAARGFDPGNQAELVRLVEAGDVADLEWLVSRIDEQLRNIPLNVERPEDRVEITKAVTNQRIWISGILDNKRTVAARAARRRDTAWKVTGLVIAICGIVLAIVKMAWG